MDDEAFYRDIAAYYDRMYVDEAGYRREAGQVVSLAREFGAPDGGDLLDIACGTGAQAVYLQEHFRITGIDLNESMLRIAREKVPAAAFVAADMCDFSLEKQFDVVVNLYGSIGYARSLAAMRAAVCCAARHLRPGGVFVLAPWSTRESFEPGLVAQARQDGPSGLCRMETIKRLSEDRVRVEMHHLVADSLEVAYHKQAQTLSLFSEDEYRGAVAAAGLRVRRRLDTQAFRMGAFVCTW